MYRLHTYSALMAICVAVPGATFNARSIIIGYSRGSWSSIYTKVEDKDVVSPNILMHATLLYRGRPKTHFYHVCVAVPPMFAFIFSTEFCPLPWTYFNYPK